LPGVEAAGPDAGRRGGLACRPGPQASTRDCARQVKSARPGAAGPGGPQPRAGTGRYLPRPQQAARKRDRPLPGHGERGAAAPATLAAAAAGGQRLVVVEGSVMGGWSRVPPLLR